MTSTIERAVNSIGMAKNHLRRLTPSSDQDEAGIAFIQTLLEMEQGALITYIECIREERRRARRNKKKNELIKNNLLREMGQRSQ